MDDSILIILSQLLNSAVHQKNKNRIINVMANHGSLFCHAYFYFFTIIHYFSLLRNFL